MKKAKVRKKTPIEIEIQQGWDCASGCICDTKCIKGIKLMGEK